MNKRLKKLYISGRKNVISNQQDRTYLISNLALLLDCSYGQDERLSQKS